MDTARFDGFETGPADATAAVIWLHGLGADCYDFSPIVPELGLHATARVRFVFPNAPIRPVTLNNGMRMRAWYDIRSLDFDERAQDSAGIAASVDLVRGLIARESSRGVDARRLVLAGFSQGGAIAALAAVSHPERLAGLVALSTYPLAPGGPGKPGPYEPSPAAEGLPCFVAHGPADPVVPIAGGELLVTRLTEAGCDVVWRTYPVPHAVHPQEIEDTGAFLRRLLA